MTEATKEPTEKKTRKARKASMFRVMMASEIVPGDGKADINVGPVYAANSIAEARKIIETLTPGVYVTVCIREAREVEQVTASKPVKL
jgi:hypothetical protein